MPLLSVLADNNRTFQGVFKGFAPAIIVLIDRFVLLLKTGAGRRQAGRHKHRQCLSIE